MNRPICACVKLIVLGAFVWPMLPGLAQAPAILGKPETLIIASDIPAPKRVAMLNVAQSFYEFWNTGSAATLSSVISPSFVDRDLPPGRPQGPDGPLYAIRQFKAAVPDLRCEVLQQIVAGDRVVSHLRFTGHFTGLFGTNSGQGQEVSFSATDILRIDPQNRIADNWHLEDNLTFLRQVGVLKN